MSRQMYLPKRAEKELKLLEAQLQDEEDLFLKEGAPYACCRAVSSRVVPACVDPMVAAATAAARVNGSLSGSHNCTKCGLIEVELFHLFLSHLPRSFISRLLQ